MLLLVQLTPESLTEMCKHYLKARRRLLLPLVSSQSRIRRRPKALP